MNSARRILEGTLLMSGDRWRLHSSPSLYAQALADWLLGAGWPLLQAAASEAGQPILQTDWEKVLAEREELRAKLQIIKSAVDVLPCKDKLEYPDDDSPKRHDVEAWADVGYWQGVEYVCDYMREIVIEERGDD